MANYLVEGLSGTGKSSVCEELKKRGYNAVEADDAFGHYADSNTGLPTDQKAQLNWMWDAKKVEHLLASSSIETVFVCGGAMNQDKFMHLFTKVFTLLLDDNTLKDRLASRTNNDFGKHPDDLARQLEWNQGSVSYAEQRGTVLIDASKPLVDVVDEILAKTKADDAGSTPTP